MKNSKALLKLARPMIGFFLAVLVFEIILFELLAKGILGPLVAIIIQILGTVGIFALLIIGRIIPEYIAVKMNVDPFALYSTLVTIFCFLGITVFLISSIMRDAYVGIDQNKKRWQWYLLVIGLINLFGAYSNRGFVSAAVLSLCCAFLTFSGFIALIIRSLLDKKEEEE